MHSSSTKNSTSPSKSVSTSSAITATSSQPLPTDKHKINSNAKPVSNIVAQSASNVDPSKRVRSDTALTTKQYMDRRRLQQAESKPKDNVDLTTKLKPLHPTSSRTHSSNPLPTNDRHRGQKRPHSSSQPNPSSQRQNSESKQNKHSNGAPTSKHPHLSSHPAKDPHISSQHNKEPYISSQNHNKDRTPHEQSKRQSHPNDPSKSHNHPKDLNSQSDSIKSDHNIHKTFKEHNTQPPPHSHVSSRDLNSKEFKQHSKNPHPPKPTSRSITEHSTHIKTPSTNRSIQEVNPFSRSNSQSSITTNTNSDIRNSENKIPNEKVTSPIDPFQHIVDSTRIANVRTTIPSNSLPMNPINTINNSNNNNAIKEKLASSPVSIHDHPPPLIASIPVVPTSVAQQSFNQSTFPAHNETPVHAMIKPRHNKPYKPRSHPYNRPNRQSQITHEIEGHVTTHHGNVTISHTNDVTMKPISHPITSADRDTSSIRSILTTSLQQSRPTPISAPSPVLISSLPSTAEQLDQVDMELDNDSDISVNGMVSPPKINPSKPLPPVSIAPINIPPPVVPVLTKQLSQKKNSPPAPAVVAPLIVKTSHINGEVALPSPKPAPVAQPQIKLKLKIGSTKVAESVVVLGDSDIRNSVAKEEKKPATALKLVISKDRSSGNYSSGKKLKHHKSHKSHKSHKHHKHKKSKKKSDDSNEEG